MLWQEPWIVTRYADVERILRDPSFSSVITLDAPGRNRPPAFEEVPPETFVFDAPNLLDGLAMHGYRTVCMGGVTCFSEETSRVGTARHVPRSAPATRVLLPGGRLHSPPGGPDSRHRWPLHRPRPLFLFVNVSATHVPHGHYLDSSQDTTASQAAALSYADGHAGRLLD
ncbi:hypothetical protein [Streptomyces sp. NPDC052012]|uniref:hypothetical protein n=1 Tax=Streptomyces sp. NPDC052012 TaxID=3155051 RepID=UPI00344FA553